VRRDRAGGGRQHREAMRGAGNRRKKGGVVDFEAYEWAFFLLACFLDTTGFQCSS